MINLSSLLRKCTCIFLLVVFTLGITPVGWLHDLVADHQDVCYHHFEEKGKMITQADVNCHCISFVAEAQFTNAYTAIIINAPQPLLSSRSVFSAVYFYSRHHFYSELRGPPSALPSLS